MIRTHQELYNYLGTVMKDLYKELDLEPFTDEQCDILHFCDELYEKWEGLRHKILQKGDIARFNNTLWVKILEVKGNTAIVSPLNDDDAKHMRAKEEVLLSELKKHSDKE